MRVQLAIFITTILLLGPQNAQACSTPTGSELYQLIADDIDDIFYARPERLHSRGAISDEFLSRTRDVELEVCDNRSYTAWVNRDGSQVTMDVGFIEVMFFGSMSLIVGQFISTQSTEIGVLDLYEVWNIQTIPALNDNPITVERFLEVSQQVLGQPLDLSEYPEQRDLSFDIAGPFVHALGFILGHELCHVALGHLDELALSETPISDERRRSMEEEADRCAIEIVNRDEEILGSIPGANLIGAAAAMGMQTAREAHQERIGQLQRENTFHLRPGERLEVLAGVIFQDLDRRGINSPVTRSTILGILESSNSIVEAVSREN